MMASFPSSSVCTGSFFLLFISHILTVQSRLPDKTNVDSSLKQTQLTRPAWPRYLRCAWPVVTSHSITVLSEEPETICALSAREEERRIFMKQSINQSNIQTPIGSSIPGLIDWLIGLTLRNVNFEFELFQNCSKRSLWLNLSILIEKLIQIHFSKKDLHVKSICIHYISLIIPT